MTPLLEFDGWFCPNCLRILRKPPTVRDGDRYHSWRCSSHMVPVLVELTVRNRQDVAA